MQRAKRGLYWDYREREGEAPWVRGRLLVDGKAALASIRCRYAEHTPDVLENRILASALFGLRRWHYSRADVRRAVHAAWRALGGVAHCKTAAADCLALRLSPLESRLSSPAYPLLFALVATEPARCKRGGTPARLYAAYADAIRAVLRCIYPCPTSGKRPRCLAVPLASKGGPGHGLP